MTPEEREAIKAEVLQEMRQEQVGTSWTQGLRKQAGAPVDYRPGGTFESAKILGAALGDQMLVGMRGTSMEEDGLPGYEGVPLSGGPNA